MGKITARFSVLLAFILTFTAFASTTVLASTPIRIGDDRVGNESIRVSNVISVDEQHVFIEMLTVGVYIVHATAPATVTMARDISWYRIISDYPITQLNLPAGTDIWGYLDSYEQEPRGRGMSVSGTGIALTTGRHDGSGIRAGSTVVLNNLGVYRVNITDSFGRFAYIVITDGTVPTPQPQANPSAWAVSFVEQAIALELVPQDLQSSYNMPTTRAEFAALAVALYETATGNAITGRMTFNDTTDVNVQKMGYLEVVTGVGGGNFNPNGQLTREQAAVMLARLANAIGQPLPASSPTFADNWQIAEWAYNAVGQAQASGIMGGVGDNQFAPSGDYTREQSIVTILRLFELLN